MKSIEFGKGLKKISFVSVCVLIIVNQILNKESRTWSTSGFQKNSVQNKPFLTVGFEFEKWSLSCQGKNVRKSYMNQVKKANFGQILNKLELKELFPVEANEKFDLCVIQKKFGDEYKEFISVGYDDLSALSQLEFATVGDGIMPWCKLYSPENLASFKTAIDNFSKAVEKLKNQTVSSVVEEANSEQKQQEVKVDNLDEFKYVFFDHSINIFTNCYLEYTEGAIHVTHVFDRDMKDKVKLKNFFTSSQNLNPRDNLFSYQSSQEFKGVNYHNPLRDQNSPNPKIIEEILESYKDIKIFPNHNIFKELHKEVILYDSIIKFLDKKSEELQKANNAESLSLIQEKKLTLIRLSDKIAHDCCAVLKTVKKNLNGKTFPCDNTEDFTKINISQITIDPYIYNSPEYKVIPPIISDKYVLVEHRRKTEPIIFALSKTLKDKKKNNVRTISKESSAENNVSQGVPEDIQEFFFNIESENFELCMPRSKSKKFTPLKFLNHKKGDKSPNSSPQNAGPSGIHSSSPYNKLKAMASKSDTLMIRQSNKIFKNLY